MCYKSGVTHVTIYAFSIENFKRSKYEVDALMDMAKIKLVQLSQHGELLDRYGARIRILGQRELIKPDVLEAMDRAVKTTEHNNKCVLNVCFPYTSREEITTSIRRTVEEYTKPVKQQRSEQDKRSPFREERIERAIREKSLSDHSKQSSYLQPPGLRSSSSSTSSLSDYSSDPSVFEHDNSSLSSSTTLHPDPYSNSTTPPSESHPKSDLSSPSPIYPSPELITSSTLSSHMFTASDPPLDLLVRTSGVERLSDFMLWQCHQDTQIVFLSVLWPEFDLWSFLPVIWEWQWRIRKQSKMIEEHGVIREKKTKRMSSLKIA